LQRVSHPGGIAELAAGHPFFVPEAVGYDGAAEVVGGPAGAPASGTPA
jgi:hypothetical protein